jgi:hypothetical protein
MRRAILAATAGGLMLAAAACDSDATSTATAPPSPPAVAASTVPSSAAPDYTADTRAVCGKVQQVIDRGVPAFSAEVGRMIAYRETKTPGGADQARKAAAGRLKAVAESLRTVTAKAQDPEIVAAGATSAAKLTAAAGDAAWFAKLQKETDFDRSIQGRLGQWLAPVTGYCG